MKYGMYIAASYAIALGTTALLSVQALLRQRSASRRLRAVDTRRDRAAG
jgi:heme exporter protein CcmD